MFDKRTVQFFVAFVNRAPFFSFSFVLAVYAVTVKTFNYFTGVLQIRSKLKTRKRVILGCFYSVVTVHCFDSAFFFFLNFFISILILLRIRAYEHYSCVDSIPISVFTKTSLSRWSCTPTCYVYL